MDKAKRQAIAKGKKGATKGEVKPKVEAKSDVKVGEKPPVKRASDSGMPKLPPMPKSRGARKQRPMNPCACGCPEMTQSTWAPGHDARAKGWALRIERGICKMADIPEMERPGAKLMLKARGDGAITGKIKIVKQEAKPVAKPVAAKIIPAASLDPANMTAEAALATETATEAPAVGE